MTTILSGRTMCGFQNEVFSLSTLKFSLKEPNCVWRLMKTASRNEYCSRVGLEEIYKGSCGYNSTLLSDNLGFVVTWCCRSLSSFHRSARKLNRLEHVHRKVRGRGYESHSYQHFTWNWKSLTQNEHDKLQITGYKLYCIINYGNLYTGFVSEVYYAWWWPLHSRQG